MDSTKAYNAIIQDLANNPADILTSSHDAFDFAQNVLEAYAKARWKGDPAAAVVAVIEQFIEDEAFELQHALNESEARETAARRADYERHMFGLPSLGGL